MATSLFTTEVPASPDVSDPSPLSLGSYITLADDQVITHIRWYFPASAQPGGQAVRAALFRTSDQAQLSAVVDFASPGTPGAWNVVALDAPVTAPAGTYCPVVWTPGRYVASTGGASPWPITNENLSAATGAGRFAQPSSDPDFPTDSFGNGCYFVDLVLAGAGPSEGDAALGLNLAVNAVGARRSAGAADSGLGLSPSATGARRSAGGAALGMNLAVSAAGRHSAAGAAGLGLRFTVNAHGSNGSVGRPVSAWPFPERAVSSYPWTPRPVRSFTEVPEP